jgi:diacylglycerol kinase (ATP)
LWIHFFAAFAVLASALLAKVSWLEFSVLVIVIFNVFAAEMFNTAIEELTNILSPEHRHAAALAKTVAAAAVLITALGAAIVGLIVFLPRLI